MQTAPATMRCMNAKTPNHGHAVDPHADPGAISRRRAIALGLAGATAVSIAGAGALGAQAAAVPPPPSPPAPPGGARKPERTRSLRLAHLTDIHLQPELNAEAGFAACLAHVQSLRDPPALVLTGGDNVMDVFEQKTPRMERLAALWRAVLKRECSLRVEPTIGNHDIWGWHTKSATSGAEPLHGKAFALDLLGIEKPYRAFDAGAWKIIVLDSIQRRPQGYACELDPEQLAWLTETLERKPAAQPVLVVSHAPIISVTPMLHGETRKEDRIDVSGGLVHADGSAIHRILRKGQVKICLSGHTHLIDRCEAEGVTYICDGAVCARWWKGHHHGVREGYGVVDLFDDGTFEHEYVPFDWVAAKA